MACARRALNLGRSLGSLRFQVGCFRSSGPSTSPIILPSDVPIEEERKEDYNPEDYYPAQLGEVFHDSYRVAVKLGYGGSSTVWLARDIRRQIESQPEAERYVALKICNNDYTDRASAEHELRLMKHITAMNASESSPGRQFVRTLLDSFEIEGPHGTHICLV